MKIPSKVITGLAVAAIVAAAIVPYISTWSDAFIADDWAHLQHSKHLTLPVFIQNCSFSSGDMYYRPVAIAYFYLNYRLWGLEPTGYNVLKSALFAATAVLLFFFMRRLTGSRPAAVVAGLVFALHPLNVSCAVWIATHATILCAFLYILTLLLFLEAATRRRARGAWYAAFIVSLLLCFGTYEFAYTLPAVILLVELLFVQREPGLSVKQRLACAWPRHVPYLALVAVFLALHLIRMQFLRVGYEMFGYHIVQDFFDMLITLFMPVVRVDSNLSPLIRALPLAAGTVLFVGVSVFARRLRRLAVFAALVLFIGVIPGIEALNLIKDFGNTRLLAITIIGFSMLMGVYVASVWPWRVGKIAGVICLGALLAIYAHLDVGQCKIWSTVAAQSDNVVNVVVAQCRGETFPYRLVFLTYPVVPGAVTFTEPHFVLMAMDVKADLVLPEEFEVASPYTSLRNIIQSHSPETMETILRWGPLWVGGRGLSTGDAFVDKLAVARISREDRARTFFFYWDEHAGEMRDCTDAMRARMDRDRKKELFAWTAAEDYPYKDITFKSCQWSPQKEEKLLYLSPAPGAAQPLMVIQIDTPGLSSDELDLVEITLSAATKGGREGYFVGRVGWLYSGEVESAAVLDRAQPFLGRYYPYHELSKMGYYRVPLAQLFAQGKARDIECIYIILPDMPEYAIKEIHFSTFDK